MRVRCPGLRWLGLGLIGLCSVAWAYSAQLEDVQVSSSGERTRVVLVLSDSLDPDLFMLADPARLVVDLPATVRTNGQPIEWPGEGLVSGLRSGIRNGTDLRLVLDLVQSEVEPDSYMLTPGDEHKHKLVIDLYADAAQAERDSVAAKDDFSVENSRQLARVDDDGNAAVTVESQPVARTPAPPMRDIVVAIDPGHGGRDPGASGVGGVMEKHVVLSIARRLASMIDEQPHMRAIMTRNTDVYVGLRERMEIAREAEADLFVSIHANASRSPKPRGVSVFALSLGGATSEHARLLAERENAAPVIGGVSLESRDPILASFMLDLAQSATIEASLDVASRVLRNAAGFTSLLRSGVEQAAFVVLKSPDMPSILVESGFVTNPAEARKLQQADYQIQLARAILRGIKGYFDSYRPGTMIANGQVHKVKPGETLSGIAQSYRVSLQRLLEHNNLGSTAIRAGQELQIPPPAQHEQVVALQ